MLPEVSVVIPTFNRRDVLAEVLVGLAAQRGAPPFEVVVVDDGSSDGTADELVRHRAPFDLRVERQENLGPAAARNRGVRLARGHWVAFLGDDTVPDAGWLAAHRAAHRRRSDSPDLAVIGRTEWHPRLRRTRFLDYINEHGLQFGFALIEDRENVPFNFFYTSNLSLGRDRLRDEPFDEGFPHAAWEDIEAAVRLTRRGLRLVYEPTARVLHDHPTDFVRFARRQETAGYSAVVFARRQPGLAGFVGLGATGPPPLPNRAGQWLTETLVRALQPFPVDARSLWERALRFHYVVGLRRGWKALAESSGGAS